MGLLLPLTSLFILNINSIVNIEDIGHEGIEDTHIIIGGNSFMQTCPPYTPTKTFAIKVGEIEETDNDIINQVITCESNWNQNAVGLAGEIGIAQFMPSTWTIWNKQRGLDLDIYNAEHQLDMIDWAFEKGYNCHWTCFAKITGLCNY